MTDTAGNNCQSDYSLDNQVGYLMRLANQRHAAIFQANTVYGLTPTQFSALVRLAEHGQCSQNHLGRLASMDVATIKGVVDRLKHKGFVTVEKDPDDKRRALISLSAEGETMISGMKEAGHFITSETLKPLTTSEARSLVRILGKMA